MGAAGVITVKVETGAICRGGKVAQQRPAEVQRFSGFTAGSGSFVQNSATMAGSGNSLSETAEITSTQFSAADTLGLYSMETE